LQDFTGENIFSCRAVQLKITLDLSEQHNVWRRVVVPLHMSFYGLHRVLQKLFGWWDYHLHEFYVYSDETVKKSENIFNIDRPASHRKGYKPVVNIVDDEEAFDYKDDDLPVMLNSVKLSEYLPEYGRMKYIYDFGDFWEHYIELEEVIDDYDKYHPICLDGAGNSPPEDVGGQDGYDSFLEIIADENHPEHENMVSWGRSQGYESFDLERVNRFLKLQA
ncbi:MAG: plasmid pRiA4b ORF-3 family protein, partial [Clostridia bacterium]|nr:plasmid pRiA4b ORF-3 family protein [Clostridia bacterium]